MKALRKSSLREIRKSLGRYLAILAIVALGVGFFCGLRVCRDAMIETGDDYLNRQNMYDYRLISTLGFDQSDAEAFATIEGVTAAAGAVNRSVVRTAPVPYPIVNNLMRICIAAIIFMIKIYISYNQSLVTNDTI